MLTRTPRDPPACCTRLRHRAACPVGAPAASVPYVPCTVAPQVETQGGSREKKRAVHELLVASGMEVSREFQVPSSSVYVQPGLQPAPTTPNGRADAVMPAAMLLPGAQPGYCAVTKARDAGDCDAGEKGSWRMSRFRAFNVSGCLYRCRSECARCRYITVSLQAHDCSWYASCDLTRLNVAGGGADHQSLAVL